MNQIIQYKTTEQQKEEYHRQNCGYHKTFEPKKNQITGEAIDYARDLIKLWVGDECIYTEMKQAEVKIDTRGFTNTAR